MIAPTTIPIDPELYPIPYHYVGKTTTVTRVPPFRETPSRAAPRLGTYLAAKNRLGISGRQRLFLTSI